MRDTLLEMNTFGKAMADALNTAGLKPPESGVAAVMIIVGDPESGEPPLAGGLNHKDGVWVLDQMVLGSEPVDMSGLSDE